MDSNSFIKAVLAMPKIAGHLKAYAWVITKRFRHKMEFEDARQEILVEMARRAQWFDPTRGGLEWFAYRVLYNATQDVIKRMSRGNNRIKLVPLNDSYIFYQTVEPIDRVRIEEFASKCSLKERKVMRLLSTGYSYHECGRILGKSHAYVGKIVMRLREKAAS